MKEPNMTNKTREISLNLKVLIIDNYDSFTYNLYQYIGEILLEQDQNSTVKVVRNDEITTDEIKSEKYDKIVISPGPGSPDDKNYFGVCGKVITEIGKDIPVLGVCLGMQGIAHFYGSTVAPSKLPMHGKTSIIKHDSKGVFRNIPQDIEIMRYHSLVALREDISDNLTITAYADDEGKEIMGLRHKKYPIEGIQFHPESFATEGGKQILKNFIFE